MTKSHWEQRPSVEGNIIFCCVTFTVSNSRRWGECLERMHVCNSINKLAMSHFPEPFLEESKYLFYKRCKSPINVDTFKVCWVCGMVVLEVLRHGRGLFIYFCEGALTFIVWLRFEVFNFSFLRSWVCCLHRNTTGLSPAPFNHMRHNNAENIYDSDG